MSELVIENKAASARPKLAGMAVAALGIVFGDIGTSPLYTLKTVFDLAGGTPTPDMALGLLSLILWTLLITVSIKYVSLVMRADNDGEGGILALMSLLRLHRHHRPVIVVLGLFGAALIYGDGAITPAISVLSAIEGLKISAPAIAPYVLPVSVAILATLFMIQSQGSARIGWVFGPVMALWFLIIALLGVRGIMLYPQVIAALNPWWGAHFLFTNGSTGFMVLGGVFLAVTGAEALYADMGHIGVAPIRLAWYGLVLPALMLNYAGQTALFLSGASIEGNIFYRLCPPDFLLPLISLATMATIIASQAIITGAFSMTRQAIHLGWCPRLHITQTSAKGYGQIYVATVNWMLMIATISLAVFFGSSDRLASAYGIAVSLTMMLTTILMFVTMREVWKWRMAPSLAIIGALLAIDGAYFSANAMKIVDGGWVPLVLAVCTYAVLVTWRRGSVALAKALHTLSMPIDEFMKRLSIAQVPRVEGTAVFLSKVTEQTPPIIIWHVAHNKALQKHVVALSMVITQTPWVEDKARLTVTNLAPGFWRLIARYGFMEKPDIPTLLRQATIQGCDLNLGDVVYYIGHETIMHRRNGTGMPLWQEKLYAILRRNSTQMDAYLLLPQDSVVEIGRLVEI
jgi:KUP system potassium uptake protein